MPAAARRQLGIAKQGTPWAFIGLSLSGLKTGSCIGGDIQSIEVVLILMQEHYHVRLKTLISLISIDILLFDQGGGDDLRIPDSEC